MILYSQCSENSISSRVVVILVRLLCGHCTLLDTHSIIFGLIQILQRRRRPIVVHRESTLQDTGTNLTELSLSSSHKRDKAAIIGRELYDTFIRYISGYRLGYGS